MNNGTVYFAASPFALTASRETAACWAGRKDILTAITRLRNSLLSRSDSSLDMFWANFGSGKSHALYYLQHSLEHLSGADPKVLSVFVEMPDDIRHFLDLYSRIVAKLPMRLVAERIDVCQDDEIPDDLRRFSNAILNGGAQEKAVARQWLAGGRPDLRELKRSTAIAARIEDDSRACDILVGIVSALAGTGTRLLVLLDEFERVAVVQPRRRRDTILSNIRSVFSRNSRYFSMVLAVTSRVEQTAMEMLPGELRTLMGMRPAVSLPEMSEDEAVEFVLERFRFFRPEGFRGPSAAPFGKKSLQAVVRHIAGINGSRVIPRTVLQALAWVYDAAVELGTSEVPVDKTLSLVKELHWESLE